MVVLCEVGDDAARRHDVSADRAAFSSSKSAVERAARHRSEARRPRRTRAEPGRCTATSPIRHIAPSRPGHHCGHHVPPAMLAKRTRCRRVPTPPRCARPGGGGRYGSGSSSGSRCRLRCAPACGRAPQRGRPRRRAGRSSRHIAARARRQRAVRALPPCRGWSSESYSSTADCGTHITRRSQRALRPASSRSIARSDRHDLLVAFDVRCDSAIFSSYSGISCVFELDHDAGLETASSPKHRAHRATAISPEARTSSPARPSRPPLFGVSSAPDMAAPSPPQPTRLSSCPANLNWALKCPLALAAVASLPVWPESRGFASARTPTRD